MVSMPTVSMATQVKVLSQMKHPNIVSYQESFEGSVCVQACSKQFGKFRS